MERVMTGEVDRRVWGVCWAEVWMNLLGRRSYTDHRVRFVCLWLRE